MEKLGVVPADGYMVPVANQRNMFLRTVEEDEVLNVIFSLKNSNSYGCDRISARILRSIAYDIVKPVTYMTNMVLQSGVYPQSLKLSRVIPLYKKRCARDVCNYRL